MCFPEDQIRVQVYGRPVERRRFFVLTRHAMSQADRSRPMGRRRVRVGYGACWFKGERSGRSAKRSFQQRGVSS